MTATPDPAKRIPKSLGTDTKLIGGYTLTDLAVAGTPAVVVIVVIQTIFPTVPTIFGISVTVPLALTAVVAGVLLVSVTPTYTASLPWLQRLVAWYHSDRELSHEAAKEHTRVQRLLPASNAIERTDGAVVGAVSVDPASMGLATDEDWSRKTDAFEDFLNTTVNFPLQLYATTQSFPVAAHLSRYESRLSDPDIESNPRLEALIEDYIEWYESEHRRRRTTIRDHYVVVAVTPAEVTFEYGGPLGTFANLDVIGSLVRAVAAPPSIDAREAMVAELDDRLDRVVRGLSGIEDVDAWRLHTTDLIPLLTDFWVGADVEDGDPGQRYRDTALVKGE